VNHGNSYLHTQIASSARRTSQYRTEVPRSRTLECDQVLSHSNCSASASSQSCSRAYAAAARKGGGPGVLLRAASASWPAALCSRGNGALVVVKAVRVADESARGAGVEGL